MLTQHIVLVTIHHCSPGTIYKTLTLNNSQDNFNETKVLVSHKLERRKWWYLCEIITIAKVAVI